jgi:hypothetical protein
VAENGQIQAGAPVAKYFGFVRQEAKLQEGIDRGEHYSKLLAKAQAQNNAADIERYTDKVTEKKKMVEEATAELLKLVVKAPQAGALKAKVAPSQDVKAGDLLAEIGGGDGKPGLEATFDAGEVAAKYKAGAACIVAAKAARDKQYSCSVTNVDGTKVTVRVINVPGSPSAAANDEIVLLPPK